VCGRKVIATLRATWIEVARCKDPDEPRLLLLVRAETAREHLWVDVALDGCNAQGKHGRTDP
jgi:hypothetical protein